MATKAGKRQTKVRENCCQGEVRTQLKIPESDYSRFFVVMMYEGLIIFTSSDVLYLLYVFVVLKPTQTLIRGPTGEVQLQR